MAVRHAQNPYQKPIRFTTATIYKPDEYTLGLICATLPTISIRVLLYALAKMDPDGSVDLQASVVAVTLRTTRRFVADGIIHLAKHNLIARRTLTRYWVSSAVAMPAQFTLGAT